MKLVIWAHSFCRSTMSTYIALQQLHPGTKIVVLGEKNPTLRADAGFNSDEFDLQKIHAINPEAADAMQIIDDHGDFVHIFCDYQSPKRLGYQLAKYARAKGVTYFIASEAPQNMERHWLRRISKGLYLRFVLPRILSGIVRSARGFVNYSGDKQQYLGQLGWNQKDILSFGYFSPPIPGTIQKAKSFDEDQKFILLLSGSHTWHRAPSTLIEALVHLKSRGLISYFQVFICGQGHMTEAMKRISKEHQLPISFKGFVSLPELLDIHREAHVFVAPGQSEPWGIRVNDAINCGCLPIVSDGMGAEVIVRQSGFGAVFCSQDAAHLADILASYVEDSRLYSTALSNYPSALECISSTRRGAQLSKWLVQRTNKSTEATDENQTNH